MNWSPPERIEPRGWRIFQEMDGPNRWAIADNTGPTPELTESGILWIEADLPMRIEPALTTSGAKARLWVWSVRHHRGSYIYITVEGALYLVQKLGMKVEYSENMRPLLELVKCATTARP